jgi:hypothetical protein
MKDDVMGRACSTSGGFLVGKPEGKGPLGRIIYPTLNIKFIISYHVP